MSCEQQIQELQFELSQCPDRCRELYYNASDHSHNLCYLLVVTVAVIAFTNWVWATQSEKILLFYDHVLEDAKQWLKKIAQSIDHKLVTKPIEQHQHQHQHQQQQCQHHHHHEEFEMKLMKTKPDEEIILESNVNTTEQTMPQS